MADAKKCADITRREFLGKSAAGLAAAGFSPVLLEMLLGSTGCAPGGKSGLIVGDDILKKAVGLLMARGADFADVYVERAVFGNVASDDRKISTTTTIEKGVGLRSVKDGRTY